MGVSYRETSRTCSLIKDVSAFHCRRGISIGIYTEEMRIYDIMAAENRMSILLTSGS